MKGVVLMNRKLMRAVAKKHGVSVREVREGMQAAIDHAYEKPTLQARCINFKDDKPTPDEVINHAVSKVRLIRSKASE